MVHTMFNKVHYLRATFTLFFCFTISSQQLIQPLLESNGCGNVGFINQLRQLPPFAAFETLISPLQNGSPEISFLHRELLKFARSGWLDFRHILTPVFSSNDLSNQGDLLLKTLLLLNTKASIPPFLKPHVTRALFYLLKKRFLQIDDYQNAHVGFVTNEERIGSASQWGNVLTESNFGAGSVQKIGSFNSKPSTFSIPTPCAGFLPVALAYERVIDQILSKFHRSNSRNYGSSVYPSLPTNKGYQRSCNSRYQPSWGNQKNQQANNGYLRKDLNNGRQQPWNKVSGYQAGGINRYQPRKPISTNGGGYQSGWNQRSQPTWVGAYQPSQYSSIRNRPSSGNQLAKSTCASKYPTNKIVVRPRPALPKYLPKVTPVLPRPVYLKPITKEISPLPRPVLPSVAPSLPRRPVYSKEQMCVKFRQALSSSHVRNILRSTDLSKYNTIEHLFDILRESVLKTTAVGELTALFNYFSNYKVASTCNFDSIVLTYLLPTPTNDVERNYYNYIIQVIKSQRIYQLVTSTVLNTSTSWTQKLTSIFDNLAQNGSLDQKALEALRYYGSVIKGQSNTNLIKSLPLMQAASPQEQGHYQALQNFIRSNQFYVLANNLQLNDLSNEQQLWQLLRYIISNNYGNLQESARWYRNGLIQQKFGFNYFNLLNLITATQDVEPHLKVIKEYFESFDFQELLRKVNLSSLTEVDKLMTILQTVISSATNKTIVESATYLFKKVQISMFYLSMDKIINVIPLPQNEAEQVKYGIVKSFLKTEQAYNLLNFLDTSLFPSNKTLLEYIFKTVVASDVEASIKEAFEYYIDLTARLKPLELLTKKEITKSFKLTEIFTDTLDMHSLTLSQKDAFKKFFKYISDIQPSSLSDFESWDQAKTRGEFMKLLFQHLLASPNVAQEIKDSITVLDVLVQMDGKGSLPP